jgi:hypothetical protein
MNFRTSTIVAIVLLIFAVVYAASYLFVRHRERECEAKCRSTGHRSYTYQDFSGTRLNLRPDVCTCI